MSRRGYVPESEKRSDFKIFLCDMTTRRRARRPSIVSSNENDVDPERIGIIGMSLGG